jgi:hypothetical protein
LIISRKAELARPAGLIKGSRSVSDASLNLTVFLFLRGERKKGGRNGVLISVFLGN